MPIALIGVGPGREQVIWTDEPAGMAGAGPGVNQARAF